jgi:hypothetical protein
LFTFPWNRYVHRPLQSLTSLHNIQTHLLFNINTLQSVHIHTVPLCTPSITVTNITAQHSHTFTVYYQHPTICPHSHRSVLYTFHYSHQHHRTTLTHIYRLLSTLYSLSTFPPYLFVHRPLQSPTSPYNIHTHLPFTINTLQSVHIPTVTFCTPSITVINITVQQSHTFTVYYQQSTVGPHSHITLCTPSITVTNITTQHSHTFPVYYQHPTVCPYSHRTAL